LKEKNPWDSEFRTSSCKSPLILTPEFRGSCSKKIAQPGGFSAYERLRTPKKFEIEFAVFCSFREGAGASLF
jgi:hypothetical protein